MVEIIRDRVTAKAQSDFVVFLIGMRINKLWKIHKWLPIAMAMPKMIDELYKNPELGFIGHEQWIGRTTIMVQYWQTFEHLQSYARNKTSKHLPAWAEFNKNVSNNGDVGIWHETYLSGPGCYECIYNNMPQFGLAKAMTCIPVSAKYQGATQRLKGVDT